MYKLLNSFNLSMLWAEIPSFVISIFLAESFYKFHSFTFEVVAFLGTWYCISYFISRILSSKNK